MAMAAISKFMTRIFGSRNERMIKTYRKRVADTCRRAYANGRACLHIQFFDQRGLYEEQEVQRQARIAQ